MSLAGSPGGGLLSQETLWRVCRSLGFGLGSQCVRFTNAVVEDIHVASRVMAYLPTWPGRHGTETSCYWPVAKDQYLVSSI